MPSLDLTPPEQPLRLRAGDSPQITLQIWSDNTKTVGADFSAYTAWGGSIVSPTGSTSSITVDASASATGKLTLTFDGTTTATFTGHGYRWDVHATTGDNRPVTIIAGPVTFRADD